MGIRTPADGGQKGRSGACLGRWGGLFLCFQAICPQRLQLGTEMFPEIAVTAEAHVGDFPALSIDRNRFMPEYIPAPARSLTHSFRIAIVKRLYGGQSGYTGQDGLQPFLGKRAERCLCLQAAGINRAIGLYGDLAASFVHLQEVAPA